MMGASSGDTSRNRSLSELVAEFALLEGRQPRAMISSCLSVDESISELAVFLADSGFNVDIGPSVKGFRELGLNALENDADVLLLSNLNPGDRMKFSKNLTEFFRQNGRDDLLLIQEPADLSKKKIPEVLSDWLSRLLG